MIYTVPQIPIVNRNKECKQLVVSSVIFPTSMWVYMKKTTGMFFHDNPQGETHGWVK